MTNVTEHKSALLYTPVLTATILVLHMLLLVASDGKPSHKPKSIAVEMYQA